MSWWNRFFSQDDKELRGLKAEYKAVLSSIQKRELRNRLQFELSKYRILKQQGTIEYQKPPPEPPAHKTAMMRFPCYAGTEFQFNSAGNTDSYPFRETEHWQECRFEAGDEFFRRSDDLGWMMGWSPMSLGLGGQFPREMMPGSLSSIRVMTGLDLVRFQSKIMFETIAPYSGVVNHLTNYTCGDKGATITARSKTDKKLAQEVSDYLEKWCIQIGFLNKIRGCCQQLLVQGEFFPRRWIDSRITLTDPSWIRGPHNEIGQNPWAYGVLSPNWPFEVDTVGAFHVWYPSNEHETLGTMELFHGRLDSSVGPSAKRSVPLSYRIRPLLPLLETLIAEMGQGETKRQKISAVLSLPEEAQRGARFVPSRGIDSPMGASLFGFEGLGGPATPLAGLFNPESGFYEMNQPVKFDAPPSGTSAAASGCQTYDKVATVAANAIGVASWMMGSDFKEASRATSLTASEPSVKTGKNLQRILCEVWEDVAEAECLMSLDAFFPGDMFSSGKVKLSIELPRCEVRDETELYERLSKQMADGIKSPQHAASEMGDDYEEERALIAIAEAEGWKSPQSMKLEAGKDMGLKSGDQEQKSARKEQADDGAGRWVTLEESGTHVFIENGTITKGPPALVGKGHEEAKAHEKATAAPKRSPLAQKADEFRAATAAMAATKAAAQASQRLHGSENHAKLAAAYDKAKAEGKSEAEANAAVAEAHRTFTDAPRNASTTFTLGRAPVKHLAAAELGDIFGIDMEEASEAELKAAVAASDMLSYQMRFAQEAKKKRRKSK